MGDSGTVITSSNCKQNLVASSGTNSNKMEIVPLEYGTLNLKFKILKHKTVHL